MARKWTKKQSPWFQMSLFAAPRSYGRRKKIVKAGGTTYATHGTKYRQPPLMYTVRGHQYSRGGHSEQFRRAG